jgi:hypothetical protein
MTPGIAFDRRVIWQGSSPSEHGSRAELCFKAKRGPEIVICRVPLKAILNALHAASIRNGVLQLDDYSGYDAEKRLCERLFDEYHKVFWELARDKIELGRFALSFGDTKSILLNEEELSRKLLELQRPH